MLSQGYWAAILALAIPTIFGVLLLLLALIAVIKERSILRSSMWHLIAGVAAGFAMGLILLIVILNESIPVVLFKVPSYNVDKWNDLFAFIWTLATALVTALVTFQVWKRIQKKLTVR